MLSEHRNEIVLGNDVTGEWQRDNVMGDLDRVVRTIREMDPKFRAQVQPAARNPAMNTGLAMGTQPGQAMYKKICAPCHTIGVGDKVGPDLRGVTERRDRAWLVSYLRNPPAMLAKNDPTARCARGEIRSDPHAEPAAVRTGCRRPDQLPAAGDREARRGGDAACRAEARAQALGFDRSFPRKRESRAKNWVPALAGTSGIPVARYSPALIPASLITFAHCGVSAAMTAANSAGVLPIGSMPSTSKRSRTSARARMRTVS